MALRTTYEAFKPSINLSLMCSSVYNIFRRKRHLLFHDTACYVDAIQDKIASTDICACIIFFISDPEIKRTNGNFFMKIFILDMQIQIC